MTLFPAAIFWEPLSSNEWDFRLETSYFRTFLFYQFDDSWIPSDEKRRSFLDFKFFLSHCRFFQEIYLKKILSVLRFNPFGCFEKRKQPHFRHSEAVFGVHRFKSLLIVIPVWAIASELMPIKKDILYGNVNLFYRLWDDIDEGQVHHRDNGPEVMLPRRFHLRHHHL